MSNLGIIGGSGLYGLECESTNLKIETSWGSPSSEIIKCEINNKQVFFLPRHGEHHLINPTSINYRANIDALKQVGVTDIISISAVGSLSDKILPGSFAIINQYIDRTYKRENTFFDKDIIAHVSMAIPNSVGLESCARDILSKLNYDYHTNIKYVAIEGPQLSSHAESKYYHDAGFDVIGMTNMPEAKLAREAEIRYQSIGMVTDFDCFKEDLCNTDIPKIIEVMKVMTKNAQIFINEFIDVYEQYTKQDDEISRCLDTSIISNIDVASDETKKQLKYILRRYLANRK